MASCGPTTQTRAVTCVRSDGQTVSDGSCDGAAKPATSQPSTDYGRCSFAWAVGSYSAPNTTCGTVTQTRSVYCQRSDGPAAIDAASCTEARPAATQTSYDTTGCTFAWDASAYAAATPACGPSTHSRTVACKRSDGQPADASNCVAADRPTATEPVADYSTCGYDWFVGAWRGSTQCGLTVTQTRDVHCQRSNGDTVTDSLCSAKGGKPEASQPITDYTGCSYSWRQVVGAWSSTCSDAATRTNKVTCQRSDGTAVAESLCDATKRPTDGDTQAVLSSCSYTPTYGAYGACTSNTAGSTKGTQSAAIASCTRSDGKQVAVSACSPQTSSVSCTPPNTSDQFFRQTATLVDPFQNAPSVAVKYQNQNPTASTLNLSVGSTLCWDDVNKKTVAAASCNALSYGANVYDVVGLPSTFVPNLREIYISQADVIAAMPNANSLLSNSIVNACAGSNTLNVGTASSYSAWTVKCGTPDTADHYAREPASLYDGANYYSRYWNTNPAASAYTMEVNTTLCWDTRAGTQAANVKCSYLPTGANVRDLVNIPATFVKDLREIYVNQADAVAALPHSNVFNGSAVSSFCAGATAIVGTAASNQSWVLKCGAPDTSDHYAREASALNDAALYSARYWNTTPTATSYTMEVAATQCWDSKTGATASASKCSYLPTGANLRDQITVPATFVKDLREIYVAQTDLSASLKHANSFNGSSVATYCSGSTAYIGTYSTNQAWVVKCGTPDTADHYTREAASLYDAANYYSRYWNTSPTATSYTMEVASTQCWDSKTGATASATKCAYLPTGANARDQITVPATFVKDLREIYVNQADMAASLKHTNNYNGSALTTFCSGATAIVGSSSSNQSWTVRCGTPDTADHYTRDATSLYDGANYYGRYLNTSVTGTTYTMLVIGTQCWDTNANAAAAPGKCTYLPTGANQFDPVTVPATYVKELREIYVSQAAMAATLKRTNNFNGSPVTTLCAGATAIIGNSTSNQSWAVRCGTPDTPDHYAKYANLLVDPYSYYSSTAGRNVNNTASSVLYMSQYSFQCTDKNTGGAVGSNKCDYQTGAPVQNDQISVPAIWNTTTKTVTIQNADIRAKSPIITTNQLSAYACNNNWTVTGGVAGTYRVVCQ